ncbi:MAG TPA: FkbM family methyltransferase, partial [Chthoniobacterales bacterium]
MNRPLLLRITPSALRTAVFYRLYRLRREQWQELYAAAPLQFAPAVTMRLFPTDEAHSEIAFTGFYELALSRKIAALAAESRGGLMVDVGANYGYYALLWAAASREHRVIAFEGSPRNHDPLRENVARNGLESQIDVRAIAVGREAGTLGFSIGGTQQTGWGSFSLAGAEQTTEVPVVTLDSAVPAKTVVELLKIDVEGADTWVLEGARALLQTKRVRHIFFEQNKERMASL